MLGSMIISILLLGAQPANNRTEGPDSSKTIDWNGIRIESRATGGTIQFKDSAAGQFQILMDFGETTHSVLIEPEAILVASDALGTDGNARLEVEGCRGISVAATPDTLLLKVAEWHSSTSSSNSSRSASTDSGSTSGSSSSLSTSVSTTVKALGFAVWNGRKVQLTLEGGESIESGIQRDGNRCTVEFDIDQGKNRRSIRLEPGSIEIDGKQRLAGDDYSKLSIAARRNSLEVKTDKRVIGAWKGDMGRRVLPD